MFVLILKIVERSYVVCYYYLFGCIGFWVWLLDYKVV